VATQDDDSDSPEIVDVAEAARRLKLSEQTVISLLNSGEIPGRKLGRRWRIYWPGVIELLNHPNPLPGYEQAEDTENDT
jgi:excisionase family DNA binding protein